MDGEQLPMEDLSSGQQLKRGTNFDGSWSTKTWFVGYTSACVPLRQARALRTFSLCCRFS